MNFPGDWQDEAYWRLRQEKEWLRACLKECADDLECYIVHHYDKTLDWPSQKRKFDAEMVVVLEARKLLAATDEQSKEIDKINREEIAKRERDNLRKRTKQTVPTDIDPEYFDREPS